MTPSVTQTNTNSVTVTITGTVTETVTLTVTASVTLTTTNTLTKTITLTITETATLPPSPTITPTSSITQTHTPAPTPTITPTALPQLVIYPNPYNRLSAFNGTLKISVPGTVTADIYIYDISGYKVFESKGVSGVTEEWNGENKSGEPVQPGLYFYVIIMSQEKLSGKIYLVK